MSSLFLSEQVAYKFLLNEADEEDQESDTTAEEPGGTSTDPADASADPSDAASDSTTEEPPADTEDPAATPPEEGTEVGAADPESIPAKRKPSRFAITVEDTKENRLFLFNRFEKLIEEHNSIKNFIDPLSAKVITDDKRKDILNKLKDKIDLNVGLLSSFTDDNLYITLDISDIFGLYKIYYSDIKNINLTLRTLVRSTEESSSQKNVRKPKSK